MITDNSYKKMRCYGIAILLAVSASVTGCILDIEEEDDNANKKNKSTTDYNYTSTYWNKNWDYLWDDMPACCAALKNRDVNVYVHYMINKDIGNNYTIAVEAFDNEKFSGSPQGRVLASNFDASKQGNYEKMVLEVNPGTYYLRAFIEHSGNDLVPYSYNDMHLIGKSPVGVYGALSGVEQITVAESGDTSEPVHIYLDQLFSSEEEKQPTLAYLRTKLTLASGTEVTRGQEVIIQLRDSDDFGALPAAEYKAISDSFLVETHLGSMDALSPELLPDLYFVLVFVDADHNGYYDAGEPAAISKSGDVPQPIVIREKRTATLNLTLSTEPLNF